jgi:hypothetical protein
MILKKIQVKAYLLESPKPLGFEEFEDFFSCLANIHAPPIEKIIEDNFLSDLDFLELKK